VLRALVCLMIFGAILTSSCSLLSIPSNRPLVLWYIGNHSETAIVGPRGEFISANSRAFDNYACLNNDDFNTLMNYIIGLERIGGIGD